MCGIIGYVGRRNTIPVLLQGLEHLEYRGYDSAGIACLNHGGGELFVAKEKGKLDRLKQRLKGCHFSSHIGIGHTRWATHGEPSRENSHPHTDSRNRLALVHNGIVENYSSLKKQLRSRGFRFASETDTEVIANLISSHYRRGHLADAVRKAVRQLEGFFAFVVLSKEEPEELVFFRRSNPLVIGLGKGESFVASDATPILPYTKRVMFLDDDEFGILRRDGVRIFSLKTGKRIPHKPTMIRWNVSQAAKGGYRHFMLKEIYEQPQVVASILKTRLKKGKVLFETLSPRIEKRLRAITSIYFVSCGTAYHAGLVGQYMMGECMELPAEAAVSSEFRYENLAIDQNDLVVLITQSGETADTLAALRRAKESGALTLAVVNVVGSTIAREADAVIYTHAGPEIGVASTKAYLAQLTILALFSLYLARLHPAGRLDKVRARHLLEKISALPGLVRECLQQEAAIRRCARDLYRKQTFIYLGRGFNYPNALEGALKLKEITYSHAHGYPAGEMKHGPIALVDSNQPVICLAPRSRTYEKMLGNIEEICARKGIVVAVATRGDRQIARLSHYGFYVPETEEIFSPILTAIPMQLFAYEVAVLKKRNVDQPRNLAKSVTVE